MIDEKQNSPIDEGVTAQPHDKTPAEQNVQGDDSLKSTPVDYGEMNEKDARNSGYIDDQGHAKSMAKKDKPGHPTGAYTDVGAGRSSVVHKESDKLH